MHELAIALEHSGRFSEAIDRLTKEIDFRADLKDEAGLQSARDAIEAIKQRADAEMRDATSKPGEEGWSLMSEDSSPAGLHRALAAAESLQKPHAIAEIASKLGMHYHEGKHSDMAIRFFEKSLNAYRLLGDIKNVKNQVVQISACLRAREQYNDAIARLEDALRIIDENSAFFDDKTRFEIKYEIGDIFYLKKDWDGATKVFDEALAIARSASDPDQLKRAYHAIAFTLAKGGRKKEAIEYYEAELKMAQDGGMLEQQGFCWNEIGALHSQLDDHKRALECYEREMECYRKAGDTKNVNLSKRNMGNALWWLDDKNKAIDMYKEVLAEAKELNDLDLVFDTLDDLGGLFRQQRQFSDALTAYQEELDLATKNENKQRIRQSYRGFGRVNFDMENYMVAIDFFSREEQLCLALNDMVNRQDALKYIGKVYGQSGRAYDGVSYYLQAADINKRLGNWNDVGQCYFSAATVNRNAKLLEKAQEYYAQALMFFEKAGNKKEMNNVLGNMAMTYYENKNFEQQIKHFEQALQLCIDNGLIDLAKNRAKDLAASYEELPDKQGYEKSIEFYLLHSHLSKDIDDPNGVIGGIIGASNKLFELGRHEESIKHLESAKSFLHQANNLKREWELFQMLGISYRQLHRYDVAKQCLDHAIEIAYRNADLSDVAWTKGSLAKLHVMHGRVQDALALRLEAIEKLDQTPVEKYPDKFKELAMHHEEIGEYYRDLGDDSKSTFAKRQVKWFKMLAEDVKQEKQCTEKIDDGIKDIFTEIREAGMKVTFLVGAGISMNPPSSLASAREIVRDLLELCVPPDEIDAILDLPNLRYETIVEHIQDMFDKELRFMDYFESVKDPNAIHITLAQAILNNHDVVTTNFDYLIEHGLIVLLNNKGLSPDKITPVITKSDFMRWSDPGKKRQDGGGLLPLFKIHGSSKNIMTGDNTKESLITTISALGKGKETSGTFSIEPFKKPAINALMRDRCLIVLGYSGNDDFDIGPFLKELPDLRRIIWINHTTAGSNVLYKVKKLADASIWENNRGIYPLLSEIRHDVGYDVYRLNVHTERFVKEYLWPLMSPGEPIPLTLSSEPQEGRKGFKESVGHLFSGVSLLDRLFFAIRIFSSVNDVAGFKRTVERALSVAKQNGDNMMMAKLIEKKVSILYDENDLESCMREYEEASALYSQLGMLKDYAKRSSVEKTDTISRDQFLEYTKSVWNVNTEVIQNKQKEERLNFERLDYYSRFIHLYSFYEDTILSINNENDESIQNQLDLLRKRNILFILPK